MAGKREDNEAKVKLKEADANESETKIFKITQKEPGSGFGWRHIVTFLTFIGFASVFTLRVNLSVAMVAMVNHTALLPDQGNNTTVNPSPCGVREIKNVTIEGPFVWDKTIQGVILSSFFYGYIVTQILGGLLAGVYGGKWVFGLGTLWSALITLFTPTAARLGAGYLIALRVLQGLGEGVTWPATQSLFANWAPPSERSQLPAFAASGCLFGTISAFAVSGLLAQSKFLGGWPSCFYVFGTIGVIWFVLWAIFVERSPANHRWISDTERKYIMRSLMAEGKRTTYKDIQWRHVFTSLPLWAAMTSHFSFNWCLYVLLTGLPTYFKETLGFDTSSNGLLSALPYLCQGIVQVAAGKVADILRQRFHISTTWVRKIFDCSGHLLPAIFVVTVGFVGCNTVAAVALLTVAVACSGLTVSGFAVNFLDLAPQFSSVLFAISNTFATIPGIVGPSITGALTEGAYGMDGMYAWRNVFFIAAAFYLFSVVFYFFCGSGEMQPWAKSERSPARNGKST